METGYFNNRFFPVDEIAISPNDRGFLFADGVYEVLRWYNGFFFDAEAHLSRLKKSLDGIRIDWKDADSFIYIAEELIRRNDLADKPATVYFQVTRGAAPRNHAFPSPSVPPTIYSFARLLRTDSELISKGISVITGKDTRWTRCNIKSVSLLPNILGFQEAREAGCQEYIFIRNGLVTEGSHANVFIVFGNEIRTHPESESILSGITRKNIIRLAMEAGISVREVAVPASELPEADEIFTSNTTSEIAPVISVDGKSVGSGKPGPVTLELRLKFDAMINSLRH